MARHGRPTSEEAGWQACCAAREVAHVLCCVAVRHSVGDCREWHLTLVVLLLALHLLEEERVLVATRREELSRIGRVSEWISLRRLIKDLDWHLFPTCRITHSCCRFIIQFGLRHWRTALNILFRRSRSTLLLSDLGCTFSCCLLYFAGLPVSSFRSFVLLFVCFWNRT